MHLDKRLPLLACAFVIVIFAGNFIFLLNDASFHVSEFRQLGVNESLGMNVVGYASGKSPLSPEFNESESAHLADVRNLFSVVKRVYYASLLFLLLLVALLFHAKKFMQVVPASFIVSGAASLLVLAVAFLLSLDFASFFSALHKPFFSQNTWVFQENSLLITLFPERYFHDFLSAFFRLVIANSAVFLAIGVLIGKKFNRQTLNVKK